MIIIDDREVKSGICEELNLLGIPFEIQRLEIGDFIVNDTIFVERKTVVDFAESLQDRRLFKQAINLRKNGRRAVMIIEGDKLPGKLSIRGALCSLSVKCYLPYLRSINLKGTAWILSLIHGYKNDNYQGSPYCSHDFRTKRGIASMQERMLMQMRQVGPDLARKLIRKFETIDKIINAEDEELLEIKGIGKQLIHQIRLLK